MSGAGPSRRLGSAAPAGDAGPDDCLRAGVRLAVPAGGRLLLAVSGGSDSMALLAAARRVLPDRPHVVHVRHHLRPGAESEAALVQAACAEQALPFLAVDAGPAPHDPSGSETAARRRRLSALHHAAERCGARWILLAHHRDDDLETLLLRLERGHAGDRALAGIPTVRALGGGVHLLRPFLVGPAPPGRAALARYRQAEGLPHADDPSNTDERIARNRVRAALARGEPAPVATLLALRNGARRRLARRLSALIAALSRGLAPEGHGSVLMLSALTPIEPQAGASTEDLGELLRLLGGCLQLSRRMDPRAGILRAFAALLERRTGTLSLPASPAPLVVRASRDALHLPAEPLHPGSGDARALQALLQTSLYL